MKNTLPPLYVDKIEQTEEDIRQIQLKSTLQPTLFTIHGHGLIVLLSKLHRFSAGVVRIAHKTIDGHIRQRRERSRTRH